MSEQEKAFDLSDFDLAAKAEKGEEYVPYHPGNPKEKLPMKIYLVGHDSKTYKRAVKDFAAATKQLKADDEEGRQKAANELLAACTLGWEGVVLDGKEIPFNKGAAVAVYSKFEWLFDQVNAAITDRSRFF